MSGQTTKSSRRAFFLRGGAALGTGVAAGISASALASQHPAPLQQQVQDLRRELAGAHDRAAIRKLHLDFASLIEQQAYERAAGLFDERARLDLSGASASGRSAIAQLFEQHYREQTIGAIHRAYRQSTAQQSGELITLSEEGEQAAATFHLDVQLCTPLQEDCTVAKMAKLQGQVADLCWESGRLEGEYVKRDGEWKIASLTYRAA